MISQPAAIRMSQLITIEANRPRDCSPWAVIASRCARVRFFAGTTLTPANLFRFRDGIDTQGRFSTAS
jgi:hypothetical protein